jgi:hypothetical protein
MRIARILLALLALVSTWPASAQVGGPPISPFQTSQRASSLNSLKIRLAPPKLPHGPDCAVGDVMPTFIPKGDGTYWVTGANQTPWETTATTLTSGYGGGSVNCSSSSGGANSQIVGHNYNTTPEGTATFYSNWSPMLSAYGASPPPPPVNNPMPVFAPGTNTGQCGSWPTSAFFSKTLNKWVEHIHNEGPCDYVDPLGTLNVTVSAGAASGATHFTVSSATGLAVGMQPFVVTGPVAGAISGISGNVVTMTAALTGALTAGQQITFNQLGYTNEGSGLWLSSTGAPGTWTALTGAGSPGTILSSLEPIVLGWLTGFGDTTVFPSDDGYVYAYGTFYCQYSICDYHNAVARAPATAIAPGNWRMRFQGAFSEPALNNKWNNATHLPNADLIPFVGSSIVTMPGTPYKAISVDGKNHAYWLRYPGQNVAGMGFSISLDYFNFTTFAAPILNYDYQNFGGRSYGSTPPQGSCAAAGLPANCGDLYLYSTLRSDVDGSSVLAPGHFALWSIYVPPNTSLDNRYYAEWDATMTQMSPSEQLTGEPQMGVALETWINASTGSDYSGTRRSTTVNPFASQLGDGVTEPGWSQQEFLGYLMTNCPYSNSDVGACDAVGKQVAVRIEECWFPGSDDYGLKIDDNATDGRVGNCAPGWQHSRTPGWLWKSQPPFPARPVYGCIDNGNGHHFAANDNGCHGQTNLGLLGWAMAS